MNTVIWRIHDGKPGHANQTLGLVNALAALTSVESYELRAPTRTHSLGAWLTQQFPWGESIPRPHLILGAGHATHLAVLAARRCYGGKGIVLMKPSLPCRWFDLCLVPQHDGLAESENVVLTRGVLNKITNLRQQQVGQGLMLVGGPSAAHGWSSQDMINQICAIAEGQPAVSWKLTTSRRTPAEFVTQLKTKRHENLRVVPHLETDNQWVPKELSQASQVWVSEDSVSMIYEAITSGASVGLLQVPHKSSGRVVEGVRDLCASGWVTPFAECDVRLPVSSNASQLHEAERCAELICERYDLPRTENLRRAG